MTTSIKITILLAVVLGLSACASTPGNTDTLGSAVSFLVEHKPSVEVESDGCVKVRFEEGSKAKGRVALDLYPPCEPKAPETKDAP